MLSKIRRWLRSRAALGKLSYWLLRSMRWVLPFVLLFVADAWLIGWVDAWEVLVGRESAKDAPAPWLTWPLSILGWLIAPAFIGGITGYAVTQQIDKRRSKSAHELLEDVLRRAGGPGPLVPPQPGRAVQPDPSSPGQAS
ncbi:DUF6313 family protein [Streptomyces sp. NPDC004647]|uniref:DUF6313 family protein n=1 Tax=Streptomyces sp. NPDC004647 TaxID=3154671 RepID=UPI0033B5DF49